VAMVFAQSRQVDIGENVGQELGLKTTPVGTDTTAHIANTTLRRGFRSRPSYSPPVRSTVGRAVLGLGLVASAALMAALGGWPGAILGAVQAVLAMVVAVRLRSPRPAAWAVLVLIPAPLAAGRHWTADLPGACRCARLPHPPPGLVSVTGLAVLLDLGLLGLALALTAAHLRPKVGKSSP
jgi:hypothetical protein